MLIFDYSAFLLALVPLFVGVPDADGQWPVRSRTVQLAETPAYFPLAVGNSWLYEIEGRAGGGSLRVAVTKQIDLDGVSYYRLEGYTPDPVLVRRTPQGRLVEYREDTGSDHLWYDFAAEEGGIWDSELPIDCIGMANLASRDTKADVPAGSFEPALSIRYGSTFCSDAGIEEEVFAAGVGLLRRTEITIAGPRSLVLVEARVGGAVISAAEVAFNLSIDRPVYVPDLFPPVDPERGIPMLRARMTIRNSTSAPLVLNFPSGQRFDLVIRNIQREEVYRWSANKLFVQALGTIELSPGRRSFAAEAPLEAGRNEPLPPGTYVADAWLTTEGEPTYRASVPFEIAEPIF